MEQKKLNYSLTEDVVSYILAALNKVQIWGIQSAKDLISVTELLQNPTNKDDLEKEAYENLKTKYETKENKA